MTTTDSHLTATLSGNGAAQAVVNPLREGLRAGRMPEPCTMVICGATGDLTERKLGPALYNLLLGGFLPPEFTVVGFARREMSDDEFRAHLRGGVDKYSRNRPIKESLWDSFGQGIFYHRGDFDDPNAWTELRTLLDRIDRDRGTAGNRLFYLAVPPTLYPEIVRQLGEAGLASSNDARPDRRKGWSRVIVEKPFGFDLESARMLNRELRQVFDEEQVYRIDHYLGKETVQNLAVFRFGNGLFEPIWNRRYIDSVQITVAETVGVEGRGEFYDQTGALRDIVQNHALQLLAMFAMEPPVEFRAEDLRDEKLKVLRAIHEMSPDDVAHNAVRGQYVSGWVEGNKVPSYRDEPEIAPDSDTETYVALRLDIGSWRWAGVPFYVRTGKALATRVTEVAVQFKSPPLALFQRVGAPTIEPNILAIRIQPDEGILLRFGAKVPGQGMQIRSVNMDFRYGFSFAVDSPDAYETLLLDAMVGDASLFTRDDEVERAWQILEPILEAWQSGSGGPIHFYGAGSWGPPAADELLGRDGRGWRRP
ncbi:MAG TPA: glucose-6-phosphate dehydrogenase [Candidatus Limnocylindria bacterium]|jgi:glucose-6-phosphate 1-dehydrogenase|nr:glucose-6-phosphate dehydrogenase [Candidatus Limnocylindria bacterium]